MATENLTATSGRNPNKPIIRRRPDGSEWICNVPGDPHSRMGAGKTPSAAYQSWEFYSSAIGEVVARGLDKARRAKLDAFIAASRKD